MNQAVRLALDTNCFIDAVNTGSQVHAAMLRILEERAAGAITLVVSLHTLAELQMRGGPALEKAQSCEQIPHYPIGSWSDQVGSYSDLAGTWADAKRNQAIQLELQALAKAGTSIRDRGA